MFFNIPENGESVATTVDGAEPAPGQTGSGLVNFFWM